MSLETLHQNEPEILPQVTFDINLGKKYDNVDFDYVAYEKMVQAQGGTKTDYELANIHVAAPSAKVSAGGYRSRTKAVSIDASPRNANARLAHETQHYIDDQREPLTSPLVGNISTNVAVLSAPLQLGIVAAGYLHNSIGEIANDLFPYTSSVFVGSFALASVLYYGNKAERNARKAQRAHASDAVITVHKR